MKKVYAYIHTHWDREWYREFEEFRLRLVEVIDDVLKKLKDNEIPSFYFDGQTSALEDYLEIKPQNRTLIKKFIKEKRLFIGPYYCSTDSFLVDSESLIKNLQMGLKYSQGFGCTDFLAYHSDTFGHSKFLPEIIKYFNLDKAIFWRGLGELEADFLFRNLKSVYLIEGYFHDYFNANVSYEKKAEFLKRTLDRIAKFSKSDILLLPLGADHMTCADKLKEQIKEINKILADYEIEIKSPFEYFEAVKNNFKKNLDCEFRSTKRNFILPGVYSSRLDLKQENARLQWELSRVVQPLQAIFSYNQKSPNFQQEIDYLHKELINNHPHDSIYGCSVDNVHKENKLRSLKVQEGLNAVTNSVKRELETTGLSVLNLSNFEFNGAVKIKTTQKPDKKFNPQIISKTQGFPLQKLYNINQVPITEDYTTIYEYLVDVKNIKPFSMKDLKAENLQEKSTLKITKNSLENDLIKLSIKNSKLELTDKTSGKVYKYFISIIDRADIGDSYNFGPLPKDKPIVSKLVKTKIFEKGRIRSILELTFQIDIPSKSTPIGRDKKAKKHLIKIKAILENQNNYIEFITNWENKAKDHLLQIKLNLNSPITKTISDDLSGYIEREFDPDYNIYKHIPAPRGIELMHNTAPLQRFVATENIGIITEGLTEYEVNKNTLFLTILRATGTISTPKNTSRGTPAGPPLPTPDLQMLTKNTARFALSFQNTIQELERATEKFYSSTLLLNANEEFEKLFDVGNREVLVNTIKTNNSDDLIIRFINKTEIDQKVHFKTTLKNKGIFITDALENPLKEFSNGIIKANSFLTVLIKKFN